ncbi:hypothetical protein [Stenotrophomonas maltophilia]|uniref:hypothetical protein n=1 Tax=Stenotrophomonas maltophilia TaxID=40324 RepID=UPI0011B81A51|nr:hypothetical protein [Stenotrophomonas maltophilia]MBH1538884.1 hypothetical protein [Stenotrophomonas maltophilia]MBH1749158.1 hypothetical protein [Stenotrophomonas maltophilia]HDS1532831.1 hypothetical protein [Stenotrophomonas maltophilia]HEL4139839.1 hypothetical protein [Stenotrophomonas maltophilia]
MIGQVFTGDVQMQCPHGEHHRFAQTETATPTTETGRPLSTALLALSIWEVSLALPIVDVAAGSSLPKAVLFLAAGVAVRYLKASVVRWVIERLLKARARRGEPATKQ